MRVLVTARAALCFHSLIWRLRLLLFLLLPSLSPSHFPLLPFLFLLLLSLPFLLPLPPPLLPLLLSPFSPSTDAAARPSLPPSLVLCAATLLAPSPVSRSQSPPLSPPPRLLRSHFLQLFPSVSGGAGFPESAGARARAGAASPGRPGRAPRALRLTWSGMCGAVRLGAHGGPQLSLGV